MKFNLVEDSGYKYIEEGEGFPIIILHGLMGNLSNFNEVTDFFKNRNFKVIMPVLPIYEMPLLKTSVKELAKFLDKFILHKKIKEFVLMGNSLGGHIGLYYTKMFNKAKGLVLTGSSGLYEKGMGSGYTKRGDYEVIRKKVEEVFYDPIVATKELVDEVFQTGTISGKTFLLRTLFIIVMCIPLIIVSIAKWTTYFMSLSEFDISRVRSIIYHCNLNICPFHLAVFSNEAIIFSEGL